MKKRLPLLLFLLLIVAGAFGLQRWQALRVSRAEAVAQRWVCPMRCLNRTYDHPGKCPVCHMDLVPLLEKAAAKTEAAGSGAFSSHGHARKLTDTPKPIAYRCPLRYSEVRFDAPGRCPFCTLPLKAIYAPGQEPPRAVSERAPWPELAGKTAVYFRPYIVRPVAVDQLLRLAGHVSADRWHVLAMLPAGEAKPPRGALAMVSAAGGGKPVLASVDAFSPGHVRLRASRRLDGFDLASVELRLPGPTVLALPTESVRESAGRAWCFRQQGDGFEPVALRLGRRGERFVEVTQGLADGDVVAGSGVFWVEAQWRLDHPEGAL